MSDDDFELYLDNAVVLYAQSHGPMPPHIFRALLILLRYSDEEADLAERQAKSEDTKDHIAYEVRRLAHWATIAGWPIGSSVTAAVWNRPAKALGNGRG